MTDADNQLITVRVRVRQVSADLGYIIIDICPDIGKVSVYGRWSLIREVVEGSFYCIIKFCVLHVIPHFIESMLHTYTCANWGSSFSLN